MVTDISVKSEFYVQQNICLVVLILPLNQTGIIWIKLRWVDAILVQNFKLQGKVGQV